MDQQQEPTLIPVKYDERVLSEEDMLIKMNEVADEISGYILTKLGIPLVREPGDGMPDVLFRPQIAVTVLSTAAANIVGFIRSQTIEEVAFTKLSNEQLLDDTVVPVAADFTNQLFAVLKRYQEQLRVVVETNNAQGS